MDKDIAIETILHEIDFEKIHAYMTLVGWDYQDTGVPSIDELKNVARRLLQNLMANKSFKSFSSGGFNAKRMNDGDDEIISLSFTIESYELIYREDNQ